MAHRSHATWRERILNAMADRYRNQLMRVWPVGEPMRTGRHRELSHAVHAIVIADDTA